MSISNKLGVGVPALFTLSHFQIERLVGIVSCDSGPHTTASQLGLEIHRTLARTLAYMRNGPGIVKSLQKSADSKF